MGKNIAKNENLQIKLIKVGMTFDDIGHFPVLRNVNLSAERGKFICILGPSGCGKTVLLYLIAGFLKPSGGKILIDNKEIQKPDVDRMMIFQDYALFPWETVYGNVFAGLESTNLSKKEKHFLVTKHLEMVGLSQFKDWPIYKLSGGMKQRVALARALVANPKVLLMDEPFSALDSQMRNKLRDDLLKIWKKTKKTILFVTHSINEAVYLGDKGI